MLGTHQGRSDRAPIPGDDIAALQSEEVLYVPDENYRNPLREAKHLPDLPKDYFNHLGALAEQGDKISDVTRNCSQDRRSCHFQD